MTRLGGRPSYRLDVNACECGPDTSEDGYRIRAAIAAITRVELQNDLGPGVAAKKCPMVSPSTLVKSC